MAKPRTIQDLIPRLAERGAHDAIVWLRGEEVERLDYATLADQVMRLAGGLQEIGAEAGERIAIFAPNRPEWIVAALGVMAAGAVVVPLDVRLGRKNLGYEVGHSAARRIFTTEEQAATLREALEGKEMPQLLLFDAETESTDGTAWPDLLRARAERLPELEPEAPAAQFYTSGTTGRPKGVPLTHVNLRSNLDALEDAGLANQRERTLVPLPLHHVYPFMVGMLVLLDGGATMVLPAGVSGPEIARAVREARVTSIIGVPRLYEALIAAIRRNLEARGRLLGGLFGALLRLSVWIRRRTGRRIGRWLLRPVHAGFAPDLRLVASGGAALDPEIAWQLEGLGWEVLTGYGLTETSPIVAFTPRGAARIGTVGRPLPGVELRFEKVEDKPGGEILVRGPNVFAGYHEQPEETEEVFLDGWFRTGDLGELDEEGNLKILARVTETIVLPDGKNIFPEEVEEHYAASPALQEVAVLQHEGALVALIVPDPKTEPGEVKGTVRREVREVSLGLPPYQRVSDYVLIEQTLPRTSLGKLRRHLLPELYEKAKAGDVAPREEAETLSAEDERLLNEMPARAVWEALQRRYPNRRLALDANPQVDLGIDSLEWVSLTLELQEEHGIRLNEDAIARISTVRDLLVEAREQSKAGAEGAEPGALGPEQTKWLEPLGPLGEFFALLLFGLNQLLFRLLFRLRVEGREHLPERGPAVIAPNHVSFLDPFAVAAAMPWRRLRRTYFGGIALYLFSSAPRRLFSRLAHVFPIDPERSPVSSLALGAKVLERGGFLVWFPEGARSADGQLQPFMPGLARLLEQAPASFVPVFISGTYEAWPRRRRRPRLHPVRVRFGAPLSREEMADAEPNEALGRLHARLAALAAPGGPRRDSKPR